MARGTPKEKAPKEAILEENGKDLYCGECGQPLGNIAEHHLVNYKGQNYLQFVRYCSQQGCRSKSHYEATILLDSRELYVFPYDECKRSKETKDGKEDKDNINSKESEE